jgi:hypothetical protein
MSWVVHCHESVFSALTTLRRWSSPRARSRPAAVQSTNSTRFTRAQRTAATILQAIDVVAFLSHGKDGAVDPNRTPMVGRDDCGRSTPGVRCASRIVVTPSSMSAGRSGSTGHGDSMSTASRSHFLLRAIAWACLGPFVALGGLAVCVFGFAALSVAVRLVLVLFTQAGV